MQKSIKNHKYLYVVSSAGIALAGATIMLVSAFFERPVSRCIPPVVYTVETEIPAKAAVVEISGAYGTPDIAPPEEYVPLEMDNGSDQIEDIPGSFDDISGEDLIEEMYASEYTEPSTSPDVLQDIYSYIINNRIVTEGEVDPEAYDNLIAEIYKQQDYVLLRFAENEENKLIIAGFDEFNEKCVECSGEIIEDIENIYGFNYAHYRKYGDGNIELSKDSIYIRDYADAPAAALTHEFGHYIDMKLGDISKTDEFYDIYLRESYSAPIEQYCKSTPQEYFAESYAEYVADAGELYNSCPDTFLYIDAYLAIL